MTPPPKDILPAPATHRASSLGIHPKWTTPLPGRDELLAEWGLPADKQIVLLFSGRRLTCGPVLPIARQLVARCPRCIVVVLARRNKQLLSKLATLEESAQGRIVPMGFTDRLPELASVATLMITRPGGQTIDECIVKSLPMLFLKPASGKDRNTVNPVLAAGAGLAATSTSNLIDLAAALLADADRLAAMRRACKTLSHTEAQL
ncbi:MAG: hypothetical protein HN909_01570 [Phycisphaerales bacterium]|jgi:UDP-N-acetylglucosamine:LPS N-acetylglucosamine transferase|nr:hypothetical protein [Phycisphaerales bacterium]MBT7170437.1 hypothetical protein [Phycisphaerales bacterium]